MTTARSIVLAVSALSLTTSTGAMAADLAAPPIVLTMPMSDYKEAYLAAVLQPIRQKTADHTHLTKGDVTLSLGRERAGRKAMLMTAFFAADTNGDNVLDGSELAQPQLNYQLMAQNIAAADTDHDGKISLTEALAFADNAALTGPPRREPGSLADLLALDPNGDGQLSADELLLLASTAFDYYDTDRNGVLSPTEKAVLTRDRAALIEREAFRTQMQQCGMPDIGKDQKLYLISAYEGGTLSNVTLAGQDKLTETATIDVGEGTEPLYITASSYTPIVWRFTGHVERVAHFFATARGGSGVAGLPGDKVTLKHDIACIQSFERPSPASKAYIARLQASLDHGVDGIVYRYSAFTLSLPGDARGIDENWETKFAGSPNFTLAGMPNYAGAATFPKEEQELRSFNPGGIADIDPVQVISSGQVKRYQVLPQEAGLLQLLRDGSLEMRGGKFFALKPFARYPAELAGSHLVSFVFPAGMKLPEGNKGHSSVVVIPAAGVTSP